MWITIAIDIHIKENQQMKTVQMTLDEELVEAVDRAAKELGTSRSAFTREALRNALDNLWVATLEKRHREGYIRYPVEPDEFGNWESEHVWGSE
jgi:metal-responsive CopG/Arc/MetJ family transcriptional regulator